MRSPPSLLRVGSILAMIFVSCFDSVGVKIDLAGPIENAEAKADSSYKCNIYACRGYQYSDNSGKLKTYSPGDVVTFHVDLVAGHRPGHAVSLICRILWM